MSGDGGSTEIAIVGAGVIGLSIAYHLARAGFSDVVVYERDAIGSGASGVAPGGVRRQWATDTSCAMSVESFEFYGHVNEILDPETEIIFRKCGYIFLAHSMAALEMAGAGVALQNRYAIPSRIVSPAELHSILPALRTDTVVGAAYCAEDGYFDDPWGVVYGFARAARGLGVRIEIAHVMGLRPDGSGWRLDLGDGRSVRASQVVLAAGSDTGMLVAGLGVQLPIYREPRYLFFSNPVKQRICDPLVISNERHFAVKQLADGQFLVSYLGAGRQEDEGARSTWQERIAEAADEILPALLDFHLPHLLRGDYDMTPDHQPIVGGVPGAEGVWIAAGLSGHGFMMAPAVGKAVANLVGGKTVAWYVRGLGIERFSGPSLQTELQVI